MMNASLKEYNIQRQVAIASGMGYLGVENFQRNMIAASGGYVGARESQGMLTGISQMGMQAYQDPYQWNRQARLLQMAGASITGPGGGIADVNDQMAQIAERFKSMTQVEARAMAQLLGISQNAADAMHALGKAIVQTTQMTDDEAVRHKEATQASIQLQAAYNSLDDTGRRLRDSISDELLPAFAWFMGVVAKVAKALQDDFTEVLDFFSGFGRFISTLLSDIKQGIEHGGMSIKQVMDDAVKAYETPPDTAADITKQEGEANRQQRELYAKWSRDINLFSSAVGQFAGIIDDKQAWAAWAGTVGAAAGLGSEAAKARLQPGVSPGEVTVNPNALQAALGGPTAGGEPSTQVGGGAGGGAGGQTRGIRNNNPGNIEYGEFAKKMGAVGSDGRFAIFPTMEQGVGAATILLRGKVLAGNATVGKAIRSYIGTDPTQNDYGAYLKAVQQTSGLTPETAVTAENIHPLVMAMLQHESGYRPGMTGGGASDGGAPMVGENAGMPQLAGSAAMKYAFNRRAKPIFGVTGPDMVQNRTVFDPVTGYIPQNIGRQTVAAWLSPYLRNASASAIMRGTHVGSADIAYGESQIASEAMKSEMAGLVKYKALQGQTFPGADVERGKVVVQLRTAEAVLTNLSRYGPGLERNAFQTTERDLTIGERPVQINVYGAADSKEIANEVHKILTGHFADVNNGVSTKMKK
jgi:hypothetical protein